MFSVTDRFVRLCAHIQGLLSTSAAPLASGITSSQLAGGLVPFGWTAGALLSLLDAYESGLSFPALLEQLQRDWDQSCTFGSQLRVSLSRLYRSNQLLKGDILDLVVAEIVTPAGDPVADFPVFAVRLMDKKLRHTVELLVVGKFARLLAAELAAASGCRYFAEGSRLRLTGSQLRTGGVHKTGLLRLLPTPHMAVVLPRLSQLTARQALLSSSHRTALRRPTTADDTAPYFLAARVLSICSPVSATPRGHRTTVRYVQLLELPAGASFTVAFVGDEQIGATNLFSVGDALGLEAPAVSWPAVQQCRDDDEDDSNAIATVEYDPATTVLWIVHGEDDHLAASQRSGSASSSEESPPSSIGDYSLAVHPLDVGQLHGSMINVTLLAVVHKLRWLAPSSERQAPGLRLRLGSIELRTGDDVDSDDDIAAQFRQPPAERCASVLKLQVWGASLRRLVGQLRPGVSVLVERLSTPRRLGAATKGVLRLDCDAAAVSLRSIDTIPGLLCVIPPGRSLRQLVDSTACNFSVRATIRSVGVGPLGAAAVQLVHACCHTPVLPVDPDLNFYFCPQCHEDLSDAPESLYNIAFGLSDGDGAVEACPLPAAALFLMNLPAEFLAGKSSEQVLHDAAARLVGRDYCFLLTRPAPGARQFHICVACSSDAVPSLDSVDQLFSNETRRRLRHE